MRPILLRIRSLAPADMRRGVSGAAIAIMLLGSCARFAAVNAGVLGPMLFFQESISTDQAARLPVRAEPLGVDAGPASAHAGLFDLTAPLATPQAVRLDLPALLNESEVCRTQDTLVWSARPALVRDALPPDGSWAIRRTMD